MSHKSNRSDRAPLWAVLGVILGAIIVYMAMTRGEKGGDVGAPNRETSIAESLNISPVDESGVVLANVGGAAKNDALAGSSEAPERSGPLTKNRIPDGAVRILITKETFSPSDFSVRAGDAVTLVVTSGDDFTNVFAFEDTSLRAIALGVSAKETRAIRFNAPQEEGEYVFYQNMPGFQNVRGVMIVKKE